MTLPIPATCPSLRGTTTYPLTTVTRAKLADFAAKTSICFSARCISCPGELFFDGFLDVDDLEWRMEACRVIWLKKKHYNHRNRDVWSNSSSNHPMWLVGRRSVFIRTVYPILQIQTMTTLRLPKLFSQYTSLRFEKPKLAKTTKSCIYL